jgi:outer membrane protein assembly factor BamD (BamD/ComL family)
MRHFGLFLPLWLAAALCGGCAGIAKGPPDELLAQGRKYYEAQEFKKAERQFRGVQRYHSESEEAEEAYFLLAETRRKLKRSQTAFDSYKAFADRFPNSRFSIGAAQGEFRLGVDHLEGRVPGFLFFPRPRAYGVRILEHMQLHYRNHSLAPTALVKVAEWHLEKKEYGEAAVILRRLLAEYPRSRHMLWARYQLALTLWRQNQGPLYDQRLLLQSRRGFEDFIGTVRLRGEMERYEDRVGAAQRMIARIDERMAERNYEIGRFYERRDEPGSAVYYYEYVLRAYPATSFAKAAEERLAKLAPKKGKEKA